MPWTRVATGALAILTALTFAAPPASAAPRGGGPVTASANQTVTRLKASPRAYAQEAPGATTTATSSGSFFSSKGRVAALCLMVVAGGYTLYSVHHDSQPVKS